MILILTYAKVCTTSLHHLLTERFPGEVFRSHGLQPWTLDPLEGFLGQTTADTTGIRLSVDNAPIRECLTRAHEVGEIVTIISGVRDPIAHALSVAMQNLDVAFADCLAPSDEETAEALATRIADLWLRDGTDGDPIRAFLECVIRLPLGWFGEELEKPFGFDLRDVPFDREQGYAILAKDNLRLLLFRHENAPSAIERGLGALFPGLDVILPHDNAGTQKPTAGIYRALQERFRLPRAALEMIYAHPEVCAYYGEDEIAAAIDRWAEKDAPAAPPASATESQDLPFPPAVPAPEIRATVFIALHNHAEWIGEQLDSLFSQWRPDIELLLIDDGSNDGGLAVALDRLAHRPDVAATVMRNSQPIGHALVPLIASLSTAPLLIQADSDDIALPGRIDTILGHFAAHPECRLLTTNAVLLTENGIPTDLLDTHYPDTVIADPTSLPDLWGKVSFWLGATSAFHRSVIDAFAPLDVELCPYGLDLVTALRAVLLGTHHYLAHPLVGWRQHPRNSHRLAGVGSTDVAVQERYAALELMALAQRLRDVEWLRDEAGFDPARSATILARCQAHFMSYFTHWSRLRNRLGDKHTGAMPGTAAKPSGMMSMPPLPPIVTLVQGSHYRLEWKSMVSQALSRWSGFYPSEEGLIWTARQALVVLRISGPDVRALTVTLAGLSYIHRQQVFLSLDFAPPVEATLEASVAQTVSLPIRATPGERGDLLTLLIRVPQAAAPVTFDPLYPDVRILGASLLSLEVV